MRHKTSNLSFLVVGCFLVVFLVGWVVKLWILGPSLRWDDTRRCWYGKLSPSLTVGPLIGWVGGYFCCVIRQTSCPFLGLDVFFCFVALRYFRDSFGVRAWFMGSGGGKSLRKSHQMRMFVPFIGWELGLWGYNLAF